MNDTAAFIDPTDPHTARLVMAVGVLMNLLESLDDLGISAKGGALREAEGILQTLGPAAVTCALLQGSESLRQSETAERAVSVFIGAALERRQKLLAAFDPETRARIETHEAQRSCSAERVLQLFVEALSGMKKLDILKRWGSGGGLSTLSDAVAAAQRGEQVDIEALQQLAQGGAEDPREPASPKSSEPLPEELLSVVGGVLAGVGADSHMLDRVMSGVVPSQTKTPAGYQAETGGSLRRTEPRVGRNDLCPCGSGRKFKKCCLR
tara:strand:+ start:336 stop:1133 length:798 start_codon:yes stop_codon:yes gene_type:complete